MIVCEVLLLPSPSPHSTHSPTHTRVHLPHSQPFPVNTQHNQIYTVDAEGQPLDLIFFLAKPHLRHFYLRRFPPNSVHKLAGRASRAKYTGRMTLSHPEAIKVVEGEEAGGATDGAAMPVEPVYRLTSGACVLLLLLSLGSEA